MPKVYLTLVLYEHFQCMRYVDMKRDICSLLDDVGYPVEPGRLVTGQVVCLSMHQDLVNIKANFLTEQLTRQKTTTRIYTRNVGRFKSEFITL